MWVPETELQPQGFCSKYCYSPSHLVNPALIFILFLKFEVIKKKRGYLIIKWNLCGGLVDKSSSSRLSHNLCRCSELVILGQFFSSALSRADVAGAWNSSGSMLCLVLSGAIGSVWRSEGRKEEGGNQSLSSRPLPDLRALLLHRTKWALSWAQINNQWEGGWVTSA